MSNSEHTPVKETKAKVYKGYHGWTAETITTIGAQTYKITTIKSSRGVIVSNAQPGSAAQENGFNTFLVTDMFKGNIKLISERKRATEKTIKDQHLRAVLMFDQKVWAGEIQAIESHKPEIGTILFNWSQSNEKGYKGNNHVVYDIQEGSYGKTYKTVELDTLALRTQDFVKPYSEKFGIGTYFEPDFKYSGSTDDLNNLVIKAKAKEKRENEQRRAESEMNKQIRQAKIEEGKKKVKIPTGVKAVIVAELYQDDSDGMTDYFSTSVKETVFLAFSTSTRNNIQELYRACENWEVSKELLKEEDTAEHKNGHSYLPNYYIGSSKWYGWKISKHNFDPNNQRAQEILYVAIEEDRFFIPQKDTKKVSSSENSTAKNTSSEIWIEDYSEKAIVVRGNTKPIKEELKALGGRFNFRLRGGAGWIFPKTRTEEIETALNITA